MSSQAILYKLTTGYDDVCKGIVEARSMSCDRSSDQDVENRQIVKVARSYVENGDGYDSYLVDMVNDMLEEEEYEEMEVAFMALLEATIEYNALNTGISKQPKTSLGITS